VAQIEERYLSKWQTVLAALQDDETRDDGWLYRHDLLSVEVKLGHLETPQALAALVAALRAPTANVRQRAVRGLGGTTPGQGLEREVIALAEDASAAVRAAVAHALGSFGTRETLPILLAYLRDEPSIGVEAIHALVSQGLPEAREAIVRIVTSAADAQEGHEDEATIDLWVTAVLALQTFWAPSDAETLVRLFQAETPAVREAAAFALGEMRADNAAADLERLLWDAAPEVRSCAACMLGKLGHDEIAPRLVELTQSGPDFFYDRLTQNYERESSIVLETIWMLAKGGSARARAAYEGLGLSLE
jgi:HEAT repeat protein